MSDNPLGRPWNDPPVVKFDDANTPSGNLKHIKKTVFQSSEKQENVDVLTQGCSADSIIPNISTVKLSDDSSTPINSESSARQIDVGLNLSDEEKLSFVAATFRDILYQPTENCEKNTKEIERRINLMEQSWEKLSEDVKQNMYRLAKELTAGSIDGALKIHRLIMVNNVREVKNWMVAVKHIIEMKKEVQNLANVNMTSTECDNR